jgi:hypothetical protein
MEPQPSFEATYPAVVHLCHRLEGSLPEAAAFPYTRECLALTSVNFRARGGAAWLITQACTRSRSARHGEESILRTVSPVCANCRTQQSCMQRPVAFCCLISQRCCHLRLTRQYLGLAVVSGFWFLLETLHPVIIHGLCSLHVRLVLDRQLITRLSQADYIRVKKL